MDENTQVNDNASLNDVVSSAFNEQTNEQPVETTQTPEEVKQPQENFDPKTIENDPNLQQAYKQMQADYTKKMQAISEMEQKFSRYDKVLPVVEQIMNANQVNQENPAVLAIEKQLKEAGYDDGAIEVGKIVSRSILQNIADQQAQQMQLAQAQQEAYTVNSAIDEAVKIEPRLNDQSLKYDLGNGKSATFGEIVEKLVSADPNWKVNPLQTIKDTIATVDAMINASKQAGKQELSQQASQKAKTFAPVNSSPQGSQTNSNLSLRESIELARKEMGGA